MTRLKPIERGADSRVTTVLSFGFGEVFVSDSIDGPMLRSGTMNDDELIVL